MVSLPFLALILGSLQILILYFAQQTLETAAEAVGRQILTGNVQSQALTQSQFQSLVCSNLPSLLSCANVMVDVEVANSFSGANLSTPTLTYNTNGTVSNQWQYNVGAQGSIVCLRLFYQWPVFNFIVRLSTQSNGTRLLMATSVFRNESY